MRLREIRTSEDHASCRIPSTSAQLSARSGFQIFQKVASLAPGNTPITPETPVMSFSKQPYLLLLPHSPRATWRRNEAES
jgi:hypothetical protein